MASQFVFDAIGTSWVIDLNEEIATVAQKSLRLKILKRIEEFDYHYSRFRKDSLVTKMAHKSGEYQLPKDAQPLFDLYQELYTITDGSFTPLIGSVLEQAGYDTTYSLKPKALEQPPTWQEALYYHFPVLEIKIPSTLDVGAAGKGYLVDLVCSIIEEAGISEFCVDAGGDIRHHSKKRTKLRIGLEHPEESNEVIGIAKITNQSLCGSAGNRRKWGNFHHIMHPTTLNSVNTIRAVWVVAKTTLLADALSTCLFLTSPEKLKSKYDFEYLIVNADYSLNKSSGFPAEVYVK